MAEDRKAKLNDYLSPGGRVAIAIEQLLGTEKAPQLLSRGQWNSSPTFPSSPVDSSEALSVGPLGTRV